MTLLRHLATARRPRGAVVVRYDRETQTSKVLEDGTWVDSWLSREIPGTKKADHETGEDEKGH